MIGSLGDIVFEVSSEKVRTFKNMRREGSARFAQHNRQGGKELLEFLGAGLESLDFDIRFSAFEGVNPKNEVAALRKLRNEGTAVLFILDGEPQGDDYWVIERLSEKHEPIDNRGRSLVTEVSVKIKEYLTTRE